MSGAAEGRCLLLLMACRCPLAVPERAPSPLLSLLHSPPFYRDELLKQLSRFVPGLSPSFGFQPNMTSPADADADFPTTANTGEHWMQCCWARAAGIN